MKDPAGLTVVRLGWLVLVAMMLFSRVAFQAAGPLRMRAFLDRWQGSRIKRAWGALAVSYALVTVGLVVARAGDLTAPSLGLAAALVAVLLADGLVNVLPAGFETFKDRMQDGWVSRFGAEEDPAESDARLFATVNLLLGLAAAGMGALVIAYRPIDAWIPLVAGLVGLALTVVLVTAAAWEARRSSDARNR